MSRVAEILKNDKYNVDLWNILMGQSSSAEETRQIYNAFLKVFPTASRYWKTYIEKEIQNRNYNHVEKLFKKCLFGCLDVELWKSYIAYIRLTKSGKETGMRDINTAYEFVIKNVGMDINSASVWSDHIDFLKNELVGVSEEERRKAVRRVYHLALVTPMSGVDQIWREYDSWEHINDKVLAKGMLAGLYQQHQNAKSCCLNRKRLKRSILEGMLAKPPYGPSQAHERDCLQVLHWNKLIDYEKSNPQKLTPNQLEARVVFTYRQALMHLRFYPEVWDSYAKYYFERHTFEDAVRVYEEAARLLCGNLHLNFIYAEFLERNKKIEESRRVYERLMSESEDPLAVVQFQRFSRRSESKEAARKIFLRAKKDPHCSFHIYLSSAYIEHFQNKEPNIALKILNLGLSRFAQNPAFVGLYIDFLELQTDVNNMREIFERVLSQMESSASEAIWEKYISFESKNCSDLKVIEALQKRRTENLELPETKTRINDLKRYSFLDAHVCPDGYLNTMEKMLHVKIHDFSGENSTLKTKRLSQNAHKNLLKFAKPSLESLIEIKPGVPFLPQINAITTEEDTLLEMPIMIKKLLLKLPPANGVQGIPLRMSFLIAKMSETNFVKTIRKRERNGGLDEVKNLPAKSAKVNESEMCLNDQTKGSGMMVRR